MSYLVNDDVVLDVVAYYRDVEGNVATKAYFRDYYAWYRGYQIRGWYEGYTNRDNGNIKGVDLKLRKRFSNNFSFNLMYTLQFSRTTGSAFNQGSWIGNYDATSNELFVAPDFLAPINGDRAHKFTYQFNYMFPQDFRSGTFANTILRNFNVFAIMQMQSGEPLLNRSGSAYTGSEDPGLTNLYGGLNAFRGRWWTNLDLRLSKDFHLGRSRRLTFHSEIFNVLNRKNNRAYPKDYLLEDYSHLTGGVDLKWKDVGATNLNRARFNADFNGDGVLTVEESAMGAIAAESMMSTMDKRIWGQARQIHTGIEFSF